MTALINPSNASDVRNVTCLISSDTAYSGWKRGFFMTLHYFRCEEPIFTAAIFRMYSHVVNVTMLLFFLQCWTRQQVK